MTSEAPVQRQLEAYNARDLERFLREFSDDVRVYRMPGHELFLQGKAAFSAHYAANRFNLPHLHAEIVNRMVLGKTVIDHERITGVREQPFEVAVVYEVDDGLIRCLWSFPDGSKP